jgi:hypothetical protein
MGEWIKKIEVRQSYRTRIINITIQRSTYKDILDYISSGGFFVVFFCPLKFHVIDFNCIQAILYNPI